MLVPVGVPPIDINKSDVTNCILNSFTKMVWLETLALLAEPVEAQTIHLP